MSEFLFGSLRPWVLDVIDALGYAGVAFLVALENVFPPIPSEVVLPTAGDWANERGGVPQLMGMIIAATLGSLIGAWILYGFSAWIGPERLRALVVSKGRWVGVKEADLDKAEGWFDRRSEMAVLLCRCVPLVRSLVSIPAGFRRMSIARFSLYTTLGSLVWNAALILVGFAASKHIETVEEVIGRVQYIVVAIILGAVGWFAWRRIIRPRLRGEDPLDDDPPAPGPASHAAETGGRAD